MGVDVFSAGDIGDKLDGSEVIRYEDPALGIYRKLTLKDGKLAGVILVGDTADSHRYMDWLRTGKDLGASCAGNCFSRRRPRIRVSMSPKWPTAKRSADAWA